MIEIKEGQKQEEHIHWTKSKIILKFEKIVREIIDHSLYWNEIPTSVFTRKIWHT